MPEVEVELHRLNGRLEHCWPHLQPVEAVRRHNRRSSETARESPARASREPDTLAVNEAHAGQAVEHCGILENHPKRTYGPKCNDVLIKDHRAEGRALHARAATAGVAIAAGGFGSIGHVGVETLVIVAVYLVGMRAVYRNSVPATAPPDQLELGENSRTLLWRGVRGFALATLGLALTSPLLVLSASAVAVEGGMTETFIGTLLVGFTTSFPEIAATIAAVRIGALDLAVGNIFGSNAFNMCVLLGMDLAYSSGPVLAHASRGHLVSAQLAVLAIGLGILAMLARQSRRLGRVRIESVLVVLAYAGAAWLLAR